MDKKIYLIIIPIILIILGFTFIYNPSISKEDKKVNESYRYSRQLIDYENKRVNKDNYINQYTGVGKDKSLILIEAPDFTFRELEKMSGYKFTNIYANMGSLDQRQEDFSVLYGFYPHHLKNSYHYYDLSGLGLEEVLKDNGYQVQEDLNNFSEKKSFIYLKSHDPLKIYRKLKEEYPEAIICIYGRSKEDIDTNNLLESINIPLLIDFGYNKSLDNLGGQIDIMETLLNILGIESQVLNLGIDLLDPIESKLNYVIPFTYEYKGTFITDSCVNISKAELEYKAYGDLNHYDLDAMRKKVRFDIDNSHGILDHRIDRVYGTLNREEYLKVDKNRFIMHAGGAYQGIDYTNMEEALDHSYSQGKRLIEIDLVKTTDDRIVASHDWRGFIWKFFNKKYQKKRYSYDEFMNFQSVHGFNQLDIARIMDWLKDHPDAYIITDIKEDNVEVLTKIQRKYPDLIGQIIPQIYNYDQYEPVKNLGYKNIIYTLYVNPDQADQVINFVNNNDLFALTMSVDEYEENYKDKVKYINKKIYIHTVNDFNKMLNYMDQGVYGIYADIL